MHTDADPFDDTVVLATIERVTDRTKGKVKRVKTLLARQRMSADAALDLATSYAEWKQVPVVYADSLAAAHAVERQPNSRQLWSVPYATSLCARARASRRGKPASH